MSVTSVASFTGGGGGGGGGSVGSRGGGGSEMEGLRFEAGSPSPSPPRGHAASPPGHGALLSRSTGGRRRPQPQHATATGGGGGGGAPGQDEASAGGRRDGLGGILSGSHSSGRDWGGAGAGGGGGGGGSGTQAGPPGGVSTHPPPPASHMVVAHASHISHPVPVPATAHGGALPAALHDIVGGWSGCGGRHPHPASGEWGAGNTSRHRYAPSPPVLSSRAPVGAVSVPASTHGWRRGGGRGTAGGDTWPATHAQQQHF